MIRIFFSALRSPADFGRQDKLKEQPPPFDPETMTRCDCTNFDYYRIYEAVWRNMERENALISYRAGWCIFLTAGIFAAEAIATNIMLQASLWAVPLLLGGMTVLSFTAAMVCAGSTLGVNAALDQIDDLRNYYHRFPGSAEKTIFEDDLRLPRPFGDESQHYDGHLNAKLFPRTLGWIWLGITVVQISATVATGARAMGLIAFKLPSISDSGTGNGRATLGLSVQPARAIGPTPPARPVAPTLERQIANSATSQP